MYIDKHFTKRVPLSVKRKYRKDLNIKLRLFATYGDLFEALWRKGYWIEFRPFHTFAYEDKMALVTRIWQRKEDGGWISIFYEEQDWSSDEGFGSSFCYAMDNLILKEIKRYG